MKGKKSWRRTELKLRQRVVRGCYMEWEQHEQTLKNNVKRTSTSAIQEHLLNWWERRGKNAFQDYEK